MKGNVVLFSRWLSKIRKISAGKGPFSHPKRRAMLFLIKVALDLETRQTFFTSQTKGLDHNGLRFGDCFRSNIKVKVVLDHSVLRFGVFGRTLTFFPSQTRARLFLITLALDPDISAR